MNKRIKWLSLWTGLSGLIFELIALFPFQPLKGTMELISYARYLAPNIHLSFLRNRLFEYSNHTNNLDLNYFNTAFYIILIVGALLYIKSKGNEKRLLGFSFSILAISKALKLIATLISTFRYYDRVDNFSVWLFLLNLIIIGFWIYASIYIVKDVSKVKIISEPHKRDSGTIVYHESPKSQRFLHHILDLALCFLIFSSFFIYTFQSVLEKVAPILGERGTMYLIIFVARLIYLPLFEGIFGISPAKFLTGSKVINDDGSPINYGTAFSRTIIRHIPLEAFSFLAGGKGWHDTWPKTLVVNTKHNSFPTKRFLWFIPAFLLIGVASYISHEMYDNYKSYLWQKNKHEQKINGIQDDLKSISNNYLIKLEDIKRPYSSEANYLKVEAVLDSTIIVSVLWVENDYQYEHSELEAEYKKAKGFLDQIKITKKQLLNATTFNYDDYKDRNRLGVDLLNDGKHYEIEKIYRLFGPAIEDQGTGSMGKSSLSLRMTNHGWSCQLISIDNIEGELYWLNDLPQTLKSTGYHSYGSFTLSADSLERGVPYKFTFTVEDSLKNQQIYQVEGMNMNRTMHLVKETKSNLN